MVHSFEAEKVSLRLVCLRCDFAAADRHGLGWQALVKQLHRERMLTFCRPGDKECGCQHPSRTCPSYPWKFPSNPEEAQRLLAAVYEGERQQAGDIKDTGRQVQETEPLPEVTAPKAHTSERVSAQFRGPGSAFSLGDMHTQQTQMSLLSCGV